MDLASAKTLTAAVGQVPFNFQIGDEVKKIKYATPTTQPGELQVRLDKCDGRILATLTLAPATPRGSR